MAPLHIDRPLTHALARELSPLDRELLTVQFLRRLVSLVAFAACLARPVCLRSHLARCLSLAQKRSEKLLEAQFVPEAVHR